MSIDWAIIPMAGIGSRMRPLTRAVPKELLPMVDKPLIDWIIDEINLANIANIVLVTHPSKVAIKEYFSDLEQVRTSAKIHIVEQMEPLGLGHAVGCAQSVIGLEDFAVILPDVLLTDVQSHLVSPILKNMVDIFTQTQQSQILVENVEVSEIEKYGIAETTSSNLQISRMLEKPGMHETDSTLAIVGRYLFSRSIWKEIEQLKSGKGGELQLTDAIQNLLVKEIVCCYVMGEDDESYDCGNKLGYVRAFSQLAQGYK